MTYCWSDTGNRIILTLIREVMQGTAVILANLSREGCAAGRTGGWGQKTSGCGTGLPFPLYQSASNRLCHIPVTGIPPDRGNRPARMDA